MDPCQNPRRVIAPISLLVALLHGSVVVGGTTVCPPPAAVGALLQGSVDRRGPGPDRADLTQIAGHIRIRLLDSQGDLLAERRLEMGASCKSLAEAAAVAISAMELEVSMTPGVDAVPVPRREAQASPTTTQRLQTNPSPISTGNPSLEVGAALLGSFDSDGTTAAGVLTLGVRLRKSSFRPEASLFVDGRRGEMVEAGEVSYERFWLSLGLGYEIRLGRVSLEPQLGVLGSLISLQGDAGTAFARATTFDSGGSAGLILQWSLGRSAIWGGLFGQWWWSGTRVEIGTPGQSSPLPAVEALLGAGLQFETG
jgi:hypothetical protein